MQLVCNVRISHTNIDTMQFVEASVFQAVLQL